MVDYLSKMFLIQLHILSLFLNKSKKKHLYINKTSFVFFPFMVNLVPSSSIL